MKYLLLGIIAFLGVNMMVTPSVSEAGNSAFGKGSSVKATKELTIGGVQSGDIQTDNKMIKVIQGGVNWMLGIGGLIVVIMIIYGGILMLTSAGGESYGTGFKVIKAALIGLAIIGTAWFIVSLGLWLAQQTGNQAGPAGTES